MTSQVRPPNGRREPPWDLGLSLTSRSIYFKVARLDFLGLIPSNFEH